MAQETILLLHPGEMGSAVGARLRANGHHVLWVGQGRSDKTHRQADQAGLTDCQTMASGLDQCSVVLSVCPPHGAVELASEVAGHGYAGHFIDANAIAPQTSERIAAIVTQAGARFTDGGIIGPPPAGSSNARLYLSGDNAAQLAPLFHSPPLDAIALPAHSGVTAASALKMCFAGWNKARTALLINLRSLAIAHGVDDALLNEWEQMDPAVLRLFDDAKPAGTVMGSARKAWRWSGEMREIATTFAGSDLPDGFHQGAADVFERLGSFKDAAQIPSVQALAAAMRDRQTD